MIEAPFVDAKERALKWVCVVSAAFAMAATAMPAQAAISECPVPPGAVKVALPAGLPAVLRDKMGNVAMPGEPFNRIDIYVKGLPGRRYMFVWNIGARWIVATEVGGIAIHAAVSTYDLGKDGKTATLLDQRMTSPTYACAVATKLAGP
jgi:hypothetical protein